MTEPPTLADHAAAFAATLIGKSPHTATTYQSSLVRLGEFLTQRGGSPTGGLDQITPTLLEDFYAWLVRRYGRDKPLTVATHLSGARAFLRYLDRRGLLAPGLSFERLQAGLREVMGKKRYRTPRIDRRLPTLVVTADARPLPPPGSKHRAKRLEILRDRAILHTLYTTGLRRAEVAALNRADVQDGWSDQALITGKGGRERVVFFEEEALEAIRAYLDERADRFAPLFIRHDPGRGRPGPGGANLRLSSHSIWVIVKTYAELAGVEASPHDFRHTKATVLLNRGAKLSEVQDLLGHASPETTKRIYAHYEVSHLKDAFTRFSVPAHELARERQGGGRRTADRSSIDDGK